MRYTLAYAALVSVTSAHGVVTCIKGNNGVMMPGLSGMSSFSIPVESPIYPQLTVRQLTRTNKSHRRDAS